MRLWTFSTVLLAASMFIGCGSDQTFNDQPTAGGTDSSDAGAEASNDAHADSPAEANTNQDAPSDSPHHCDTSALPWVDSCVIDEHIAIFVSPLGDNDLDCGTRQHPCSTIDTGLRSARDFHKKRLYICADKGDYAENVVVTGALDGLEVYGGFKCDDWSYDTSGSLKAKVVGAADQPAWKVEGLTKGMTLWNLDISAQDASKPSGSSIAMWIVDSSGVQLHQCDVKAGKGAHGKHGNGGSKGDDGQIPGKFQKGQDAACGTNIPTITTGGGWSQASACGSKGGHGAMGSINQTGAPGDDGTPTDHVLDPDAGKGGTGTQVIGENGHDGIPGSAGKPGARGAAAAPGKLTKAGYVPGDGNPGAEGFPGQGGGGGGSSASNVGNGTPCVGAAGGAGGMGGCGGKGGYPGKGGGASIALLVWDSAVVLEACDIEAADAGNGGNGGKGGPGGLGVKGGDGGDGDGMVARGGDGGKGGDGGPGGVGSGGSGGDSWAIAFHGNKPQGSPTVKHANAGNPGKDGDGNVSAHDGSAEDWHVISD